jgi:hypothetical protein
MTQYNSGILILLPHHVIVTSEFILMGQILYVKVLHFLFLFNVSLPCSLFRLQWKPDR